MSISAGRPLKQLLMPIVQCWALLLLDQVAPSLTTKRELESDFENNVESTSTAGGERASEREGDRSWQRMASFPPWPASHLFAFWWCNLCVAGGEGGLVVEAITDDWRGEYGPRVTEPDTCPRNASLCMRGRGPCKTRDASGSRRRRRGRDGIAFVFSPIPRGCEERLVGPTEQVKLEGKDKNASTSLQRVRGHTEGRVRSRTARAT